MESSIIGLLSNNGAGLAAKGAKVERKPKGESKAEKAVKGSTPKPVPAPAPEKPKREPKPAHVVIHASCVIKPTKRVWAIAAANPDKGRAEIIRICEESGIATHTARTQYQRWYAAGKPVELSPEKVVPSDAADLVDPE